MLCELQHPATQARSLCGRSNSYVVQEHRIALRDEHKDALHDAVAFHDVHAAFFDQGAVVIEHRPWLSSYARHVMGVRGPDDFLEGSKVAPGG